MGEKTRSVFCIIAQMVLALVVGSVSYAEIYQCDGKWTNKPCSGAIERAIHESVGDVSDAGGEALEVTPEVVKPGEEELEPLAPRFALARKLRKTSKEFSQKHHVSISKEELHAFDERCTKRETPMAQCQAEYEAFVQKLNVQVQQKSKK